MYRLLISLILTLSIISPCFAGEFIRVGDKIYPRGYVYKAEKAFKMDAWFNLKPVIIINGSNYPSDRVYFDAPYQRDKAFSELYKEMNMDI